MGIFDGKKAVVIGSSGGIGFEVGRMLLKNGADLVIHGRDEKRLESARRKLLEEYSGNVQTVLYDFSPENFCDIKKSMLNQEAEKADILCVCFGPFLQKKIEEMDVTDWQKISLLDYALPGFFVSSALKGMIQKKWGRILLFGGTGTDFRTVFKTNAAYAGAKTGTGVLVQSVASLYAGHGITCNAVLPGFTQTEYLDDKTVRDLEEKIPGHTLISAGDIAKAAEFLLSDRNLNGVLLKIDRGWTPFG